MPHHAVGQRLDVVGHHVVPILHQGVGPGHAKHAQRGPGRRSEGNVLVVAAGFGQPHDVLPHQAVDVDLPGGGLEPHHVLRGCYRLELFDGVGLFLALDYGKLLGEVGVPQADPDQEAVQLGFRQRKGALVLDGVLGGQHNEGRFQEVGRAVDRYL